MRNGPIPLSRGRRACHRDNRVTKRGLLCDGGETRAARSIWQAIAAWTGAAVPGGRVNESVREIKGGPGGFAPAPGLPAYDCATGPPLPARERDTVPQPVCR